MPIWAILIFTAATNAADITTGLGREGESAAEKVVSRFLNDGRARSQATQSLKGSLAVLERAGAFASEEALKTYFRRLLAGGGNASVDEEVPLLLLKKTESLSQGDFSHILRSLSESTDRGDLGGKPPRYLSATRCLEPELRALGLRKLMREANPSASEILSRAPRGLDLQKDLLRRYTELTLVPRGLRNQVPKLRRVNAAEFTELSDSEAALFWDFLQRVKALRESRGQKTEEMPASQARSERLYLETLLQFDRDIKDTPVLSNRLWLNLYEGYDAATLDQWTELLQKAGALRNVTLKAKNQSLVEWFESQAGSKDLKDTWERLKKKNCWNLWPEPALADTPAPGRLPAAAPASGVE